MAAAKKKKTTTKDTINKKEIERAEDIWERYNIFMKWSTVFVCVSLLILAAVFIR